MAIWGEASYKVKRAITFHKRFSVAELVDATDLSYGQVEQVVQRLIKQGYVRPLEDHELNPAEQAVARRVGRPRKRYILTEDPAKREEFYAGVEAIASAERLSRARERKPSTPYFNRAMQMIEAIERGTEPPSTDRLEEVEALLAYGRDFEGLIPEGAEIVQAYYDLAQARLKALRGNYPQAEELLAQAEEAFQTAGLDKQAQRSIDLRLTFRATQGFVEVVNRIRQQADPTPALEALKRLIYDFPSPSYLLLPFRQAIEAIGAVSRTRALVVAREWPTVSLGKEIMGREPASGGVVYVPTEGESLATEKYFLAWLGAEAGGAYIYAEGESAGPIYRRRIVEERGGRRIVEEELWSPTKGKVLMIRK